MKSPHTIAIAAFALLLPLAFSTSQLKAETQTDTAKAARKQLWTLPPAPKEGRFEMSYDRVWPDDPGQPHICLWADDKYAAVSITIDDNCQPDHQWWIEQGKKYGFHFTWFVVTGNIDQPTRSFSGSWEDFRKLRELGHDVQSHTVSHHKDDADRSDEEVRYEYGHSKEDIEKNLPGAAAVCMAYPCGSGKDDIAAESYIACRGVVGVPNAANRINYIRTGSCNIHPDTVDMLLTGRHASVKWLNSPTKRRSWLAPVYHFVHAGHTPKEKAANAEKAAAELAHLATKRDEIWVDLFRNVACYGMERDTAKLEITKSTPQEICFSLSDDMNDTIFTYPLTIKVRLPESWEDSTATQNGQPVKTQIVEHEGKRYALVHAVPDRGEVRLSPTKSKDRD